VDVQSEKNDQTIFELQSELISRQEQAEEMDKRFNERYKEYSILKLAMQNKEEAELAKVPRSKDSFFGEMVEGRIDRAAKRIQRFVRKKHQ